MAPIVKITKSLVRHNELRVDRNILFLHRALVGNYNRLRELKAGGDWGSVMCGYAGYAVAVAEGRVEARAWSRSLRATSRLSSPPCRPSSVRRSP